MKKFLLILLLLPLAVSAQEININSGSFTGCGGVILDTGLNGGSYSENENFTLTVCPEDPETIININWSVFNLVGGATMAIYDGDDTNAPLFGTFTGSEVQGDDFFTGDSNASGCLTLVFTSFDEGGGDFAGVLSCGYPCDSPFAVVETGLDNPALICPGQEVTFDASPSYVSENFEIVEYIWEFGDGTTITTDQPIVSHTYDTPGAYRLDLYLTDSNDCSNSNLADIILLVSTDPDFSGTSEDVEICVGQEVDLNGVVAGVSWDATPDANFGGALFIPDDQSQCFDTELTYTSFSPGQEVTDPSDFESLFINFEHSFMGDLVITLICPNGQNMILHQQGGGGTYLGIPVDNDGTPDVPGVGFDYWWAPDAPNGTWVQESGGVNTLPSGTYSSVQPWTNLVGCPLNGTWTLEICDLWASDNGFIFDWALFFDESLYPELISFTPTFGAECDSTSWSGPDITDTSEDCNTISVQPDNVGTETYTFTATNNHGCTYEHTVNVTAVQGPIAQTAENLYFCGDPVVLNGNIQNPQGGTSYNYTWTPEDLLNNPNSQNPSLNGLDEPTVFTLTVAPSDAPECASSSDVFVDIPQAPVPLEFDSLSGCLGSNFGVVAPEQPAEWAYNYNWYNLSSDTPEEPVHSGESFQMSQSGLYELVVSMDEPCDFSASGQILVVLEPCDLGDIPNIFSPNNDGINDTFRIEGLQYFSGSTLKVYNRWGSLVFESDNYMNNWRPSPDDVTDGTYFYILGVNFHAPRGMEYFNGTINIVRTTVRR